PYCTRPRIGEPGRDRGRPQIGRCPDCWRRLTSTVEVSRPPGTIGLLSSIESCTFLARQERKAHRRRQLGLFEREEIGWPQPDRGALGKQGFYESWNGPAWVRDSIPVCALPPDPCHPRPC